MSFCENIPFDRISGGETVSLTSEITASDQLRTQRSSAFAVRETGRWAQEYALYDLGVGQYLLYRIELPEHDGAAAVVDYKQWKNVGNGGVHKYTSKPKVAWYVTEGIPSADFSGNTDGWKRIDAGEQPDPDNYTYTYTLADKGKEFSSRTIYACMAFLSNSREYFGHAGGNDGAWIENITFNRLVETEVPVSGIRFASSEVTMPFGRHHTLKAELEPANCTLRRVNWSSSDPAAAKIDQNGTVLAMAPGKAEITATAADGGYTAVCTVLIPDETTEIHLVPDHAFDTRITETDADDPLMPLNSWYYSTGNGLNSTAIAESDSGIFRKFKNNAYAIYKLRIPGGVNARIRLEMMKNYTEKNRIRSGIVGAGGEPCLHVLYTTEEITLANADEVLWRRADDNTDWNGDICTYTFPVSEFSEESRWVYVKVYSTNIGQQSACITGLSFETVAPRPETMLIAVSGRTEYKVGDLLDLRGFVFAVRYSDRSAAILKPDEYTADKCGALKKEDTSVTVTMKGSKVSASFPLSVIEDDT